MEGKNEGAEETNRTERAEIEAWKEGRPEKLKNKIK